jgi:succinoglycan biosynthesis protein ExoA
VKRVSIIAPMLDEIGHVDELLDDIVAQDFEGAVEILIADGGSVDGSRELIVERAEIGGLNLTLIDNPRRFVAPGLNACIRRASGELIVRMDCHSRYPSDYVRRCVEAAEATGAWNVGGIYEPEGVTRIERAVACALSSPFGGVNWTRQGEHRSEVDTVYLGAFLPLAFERAGLYDELLVRNQDDELNLRIRRAGGRVVLDSAIRARYRPRGSFRAVWRQYREYGYWKVEVMRKHRKIVSARSLAPGAFVLQLATLGAAATVSRAARRLLTVNVTVYGVAAGVSASKATLGRAEEASLVPLVAAVFPCFHLAYGVGMLDGFRRAVMRRLAAPGRDRVRSEQRPAPSRFGRP